MIAQIANIVELLRKNDFYGAGEFTEIAKGKRELITSMDIAKAKIKRIWQSRNK